MKGKFKNNLIIELSENSRKWVLRKEFIYVLDKKLPDWVVFVEEGFKTDLVTVPRCFRFIIHPAKGKYVEPSVIHDKLLVGKEIYSLLTGDVKKVSRFEANRIFKDAMKSNRVGLLSRYFLFSGVFIYDCFVVLLNKFKK